MLSVLTCLKHENRGMLRLRRSRGWGSVRPLVHVSHANDVLAWCLHAKGGIRRTRRGCFHHAYGRLHLRDGIDPLEFHAVPRGGVRTPNLGRTMDVGSPRRHVFQKVSARSRVRRGSRIPSQCLARSCVHTSLVFLDRTSSKDGIVRR